MRSRRPERRVRKLLEKAASGGMREAEGELGGVYFRSRQVKHDPKQALKWIGRAAQITAMRRRARDCAPYLSEMDSPRPCKMGFNRSKQRELRRDQMDWARGHARLCSRTRPFCLRVPNGNTCLRRDGDIAPYHFAFGCQTGAGLPVDLIEADKWYLVAQRSGEPAESYQSNVRRGSPR